MAQKENLNRVCFLSVYFGEIPGFFRIFLCSCAWNRNYDFLLICDRDILYDVPENVCIVKMGLQDFRKRVQEIIGLRMSDIKPYKICDFRPAFGELFHEYICDYEFWGILDTDLLLGDLDKFITKEILDNNDKIFTMGHMSLVRNKAEINSLYKKDTLNSRNYKKIFLNPISCVFDEYEGFNEKFVDEGYRVYKEKACGDIHCMAGRIEVMDRFLCKLIQPNNSFLSYCNDKNYKHEIFVLDCGRVYKLYFEKNILKIREYSYIHKLELEFEGSITKLSRLLILRKTYKEDEDFFARLDNGGLTPEDMDLYNRQRIFKKGLRYLYLYFRLNARKCRKKYFPRNNEM